MGENKLFVNRVSRRKFVLGAGLAGLGVALGACSQQPSTPAAPAATQAPGTSSGKPKVTIVVRGFFGPDTNPMFEKQCADWGSANNVDVQCDVISMNDIPAKAATAAETGAGPDIIHLFDAVPFIYADKLVDVSDLADELANEYGGFYPIAEDVCKVEGKWVALPHTGTTHVMVYRIDVLDKLGLKVPDTWDEFLEVGKALKAEGWQVGWPIAHAAGDGNSFAYTNLWCNGGREFDEAGKLTLDSDGTALAMTMCKRLYEEAFDPGVTSWDDSSNNRAFLAEQLALTGNSPSIYNASMTDAPHLTENIGQAFYPQGPDGRHLRAETQAFGLFKYSKAQDEAKALMKHLMSRDQMAPWLEAAGGDRVGILRTYEDLPMWKEDPKLTPVMEAMEFAHMPGWPFQSSRAAAEAFNNFILIDMESQVISGTSPEDAIKWGVEQYKRVMQT